MMGEGEIENGRICHVHALGEEEIDHEEEKEDDHDDDGGGGEDEDEDVEDNRHCHCRVTLEGEIYRHRRHKEIGFCCDRMMDDVEDLKDWVIGHHDE
jgi:hypothetical protein